MSQEQNEEDNRVRLEKRMIIMANSFERNEHDHEPVGTKKEAGEN